LRLLPEWVIFECIAVGDLAVAVRLGACLGWAALLTGLLPGASWAQHVTVDGRFSPAQALAGPNYAITANLGKQVGTNLFQSFGIFGLATNESATFSGPAAISNVIGRVTGGSASSINGNIKSTITGANLYLINPSGIVFGPNAKVNVSGSFHASTANYLKMADGAKFRATNPNGSTLSAAPPAAFGFLTASPAKITVNGSTLGPVPGTLGLVGGPVLITGGTLSAPAGTIHVASVAGTGEVPVDPRNAAALTVKNSGPVSITRGSTLDVSDPSGLGSGGSVFIHSGALTINASEINADNYGSAAGGQLVLRGESQVALSNDAYVHSFAQANGSGAGVIISTAPAGVISAEAGTVLTGSYGAGSGGSLSVSTGQLTITNGGVIGLFAAGTGSGGSANVSVAGLVSINGEGAPSALTGIVAEGFGSGNAGSVAVTAGTLSIVNNGLIAAAAFGSGNSGSVSVAVPGVLTIDGTSGNQQFFTGIIAQGERGSTGNAGSVTVSAGALSLVNSGVIAAGTFGPGRGGTVSVGVAGPLAINGISQNASSATGITSESFPGSTGNAGNVSVTAGTLTIVGNGVISGATLGSGNGGDVVVRGAGQLVLDGGGNQAFIAGITSEAFRGSTGNAGSVAVAAGALSIVNNDVIASNTFGPRTGRQRLRLGRWSADDRRNFGSHELRHRHPGHGRPRKHRERRQRLRQRGQLVDRRRRRGFQCDVWTGSWGKHRGQRGRWPDNQRHRGEFGFRNGDFLSG